MTPASWPALVLAAGLGTRLAPLSAHRAKPALPVAGQPLIVRILRQLRAAGVRRVVINLHHKAETLTGVVGDGSAWGLDVRYSWEPEPLGSGGGPARALPLLAADRFLIVNGDTLAAVDLTALTAAHAASGAAATLAVAPARLDKYNALLGDAQGLLGTVLRGTSASALPPGARPWHFVGVQAVDARALAGVSPDTASDILRDVYPRLVHGQPGAVRLHEVDGAFVDIGTPGDYLAAALRLARDTDGIEDRGDGVRIDPTATVTDCVLWDRVTVGAGAHLTHCVVTDDVAIPAGVRYDRMVVTPTAVVPLTA